MVRRADFTHRHAGGVARIPSPYAAACSMRRCHSQSLPAPLLGFAAHQLRWRLMSLRESPRCALLGSQIRPLARRENGSAPRSVPPASPGQPAGLPSISPPPIYGRVEAHLIWRSHSASSQRVASCNSKGVQSLRWASWRSMGESATFQGHSRWHSHSPLAKRYTSLCRWRSPQNSKATARDLYLA